MAAPCISLSVFQGPIDWSDTAAVHVDDTHVYYSLEIDRPECAFVKALKSGEIVYALKFTSVLGGGVVISSITSDLDGNAYLAMYDSHETTNTWQDYSVVKIGPSGIVIWKIGLHPIMANNYLDNIAEIKMHPDGFLVFCSGLMRSYITDNGSGGLAIVAVSKSGDLLWAKTAHPGQRLGYFYREYDEIAPEIIFHTSGDISVVSSVRHSIQVTMNAIVVRFSKTGELIFARYFHPYEWSDRYGYGSVFRSAMTFATVDGEGLILAAYMDAYDYNNFPKGFVVWKVDNTGSFAGSKIYYPPSGGYFYSFERDPELISIGNYVYLCFSCDTSSPTLNTYRSRHILKIKKEDFSLHGLAGVLNLYYVWYQRTFENEKYASIRFNTYGRDDDLVLTFDKSETVDPFNSGFFDINVEEYDGYPLYLQKYEGFGTTEDVPVPWTDRHYDYYSYDETGLVPKDVPADQCIMVAEHVDPLVNVSDIKKWIYFYHTAGTWSGADTTVWEYAGIDDAYGLEGCTPYLTTFGVPMLFLNGGTFTYWSWYTDVLADMWNFGVITESTEFTIDGYLMMESVSGFNVFADNGTPIGLSSSGYESAGGWAICLYDDRLEFRIGSQNNGAVFRCDDTLSPGTLYYFSIDVFDGLPHISLNGQRQAASFVSGTTIVGKDSNSVADWGTGLFWNLTNKKKFLGKAGWIRCIENNARNKTDVHTVPALFCPRKQISISESNVPDPISVSVPEIETLWKICIKPKFWTGFNGTREYEVGV